MDKNKLPTRPNYRIVAASYLKDCRWGLLYSDGLYVTYSAAVQCGYSPDANADWLKVSDDGTQVIFHDGTSMSAELLRVDLVRQNTGALAILCAFCTIAIAILQTCLALSMFAQESVYIIHIGIAVLSTLSTIITAKCRNHNIPYLGAVCTAIGVGALSYSYTVSAFMLTIGMCSQLLYLAWLRGRASMGYC